MRVGTGANNDRVYIGMIKYFLWVAKNGGDLEISSALLGAFNKDIGHG